MSMMLDLPDTRCCDALRVVIQAVNGGGSRERRKSYRLNLIFENRTCVTGNFWLQIQFGTDRRSYLLKERNASEVLDILFHPVYI